MISRCPSLMVAVSWKSKRSGTQSNVAANQLWHRLVQAPDKYVCEAFEPFKSRLRKNWNKGFQALMKYDEYSVRGFMMSHGITPL